jgi:predicted exporter
MIKFLRYAWLICILMLTCFCAWALFSQNRVQFDLLDLLPQSNTKEMQASRLFMQDNDLAGSFVLMLGHESHDLASKASEELYHEIMSANLPVKLMRTDDFIAEYSKLFKQIYPYRAGLLSSTERNLIINGQGDEIVTSALSEIMSPVSLFGPPHLESDPFYLFPKFALSLKPQTNLNNDFQGKSWQFIKGSLQGASFSLKLQQEIADNLYPIFEKIKQKYNVELLKVGAIFYAVAGAHDASHDISLISTISIIGIILTLWLVFGTIYSLGIALVSIYCGVITGIALALVIFTKLHILSLVFGCSLVGVCVDYAIHYYCASYKTKNNKSVLASLFPALPLSVLSSCFGYGVLVLVPFPGMQQMAVLAVVGLAASFVTVCVWGPVLVRHQKTKLPARGLSIQDKIMSLARLSLRPKILISVITACIILCVLGFMKIKFSDDVRGFQSLDSNLRIEENTIKSIVNFDNSTKFLNVHSNSLENLLLLEEEIMQDLDLLIINKDLTSYRALAALQPSLKRQENNRQLLQDFYHQEWPGFTQKLGIKLDYSLAKLGFDEKLLDQIIELPIGWRELVHQASPELWYGRIMVNEVFNPKPLIALGQKYTNVAFIDQTLLYSQVFASYRHMVSLLSVAVIVAIVIVLSLIVGLKGALLIVAPVVLSILTTVAIISLTTAINLFHCMGLLLVLCIGMDYALFLYIQKGRAHLLSNALAAITTIISFGFLWLSKTTAVSSFGSAIFIGIMLSFVLTTMILGKCILKQGSNHD